MSSQEEWGVVSGCVGVFVKGITEILLRQLDMDQYMFPWLDYNYFKFTF